MKLSEAIREGAKLRPQAQGNYFSRAWVDHTIVYSSCALGAACEYVLHWNPEEVYFTLTAADVEKIEQHLNINLQTQVENPVYPEYESLDSAIISLNDTHHWTRERIADWLLSIGY